MILKTERLILRPWLISDAKSLYKYASDERIGPSAGWPVHKDVDDSRNIIKTVLSKPETYAVVLKDTEEPIGSIGLMIGGDSSLCLPIDEAEIGYWIGVCFWGNGFIPEAVKKITDYGFNCLGLKSIWCGYFEGNNKSRRVQEKCGFIYHHTIENKYFDLIKENKTEHITRLVR